MKPTDVTSPVSLEWRFDPPPEVLQSQLFATNGYLVVSGLFDEQTLQGLRGEAEHARVGSARHVVPESDGTDGRGGSPARAFRSSQGRELHWNLHGSLEMSAALSNLCGATVCASGCGTYSYYEEPGDFLAIHRDILQCDVATITSLTPSSYGVPTGELTLYPELIREPLSTVRAAGRERAVVVPLDRGHTIILLGGLVPHEVTPTLLGQVRIVALSCYRMSVADADTGTDSRGAC